MQYRYNCDLDILSTLYTYACIYIRTNTKVINASNWKQGL